MTNGKSRKKIDGRRALAINEVANLHGVTSTYVRIALRGEQQNEMTELLKKDFDRLYKAINNALK